MPNRTCSVAECDRAYYAKGMCQGHWRRAARGKPVDGPIRVQAARGAYGDICTLAGCDRPHSAKGMCKSHYALHLISQLSPEEEVARQDRIQKYRAETHLLARRGAIAALPFSPSQVALRMAYWGNRCWICSGPFDAVDHMKPIAKGGGHLIANLRPICRPCNTRKCARWPLTEAMLAAIRARRPWNPAEEPRSS